MGSQDAAAIHEELEGTLELREEFASTRALHELKDTLVLHEGPQAVFTGDADRLASLENSIVDILASLADIEAIENNLGESKRQEELDVRHADLLQRIENVTEVSAARHVEWKGAEADIRKHLKDKTADWTNTGLRDAWEQANADIPQSFEEPGGNVVKHIVAMPDELSLAHQRLKEHERGDQSPHGPRGDHERLRD